MHMPRAELDWRACASVRGRLAGSWRWRPPTDTQSSRQSYEFEFARRIDGARLIGSWRLRRGAANSWGCQLRRRTGWRRAEEDILTALLDDLVCIVVS